MPGIFVVSYVALWLLVLCQGTLLLLVYRHFGMLALNTTEGIQRDGLPIGSGVPSITAMTASGETIEWQPQPGLAHLMAFVSPDCGPCTKILPMLVRLADASELLRVTMIVPGPLDVARRLMGSYHPPASAICICDDGNIITSYYRVRVTPFAMMVGDDGRVRAKGLCDDVGRLEKLVEAAGVTLPEAVAAPLASSAN